MTVCGGGGGGGHKTMVVKVEETTMFPDCQICQMELESTFYSPEYQTTSNMPYTGNQSMPRLDYLYSKVCHVS